MRFTQSFYRLYPSRCFNQMFVVDFHMFRTHSPHANFLRCLPFVNVTELKQKKITTSVNTNKHNYASLNSESHCKKEWKFTINKPFPKRACQRIVHVSASVSVAACVERTTLLRRCISLATESDRSSTSAGTRRLQGHDVHSREDHKIPHVD